MIYPTDKEIILLKSFVGNINIKSDLEILKMQNFIIEHIKHAEFSKNEIIVENIIKKRIGFCYDRSLLMQKILLLNGFEIRPIYLYSNAQHNSTSCLDFFKKETFSHSVFEVYLHNSWILIRTNSKQTKLTSLDTYLKEKSRYPNEYKYVKYLSDRNGRFIYPNFIPDLY